MLISIGCIAIDSNVISVFTDENIIWLANRIEEISDVYNGDNSGLSKYSISSMRLLS